MVNNNRSTTTLISIDVGTTNLKGTVIDEGKIIDHLSYRYQKKIVTAIKYEMSPGELCEAVVKMINELFQRCGKNDIAIVLTTAMHSLILLDGEMTPLTNVITWADTRGSEYIPKLDNELARQQYERTGTPLHSMNPYYKLCYFKSQSVWQQVSYIASIKDYLFYYLTGEWCIDVSNSSASGLYELKRASWDKESLFSLGINEKMLPIIKPCQYSAKLSLNTIKLPKDTLIYLGTSDGVSSNLAFSSLNNPLVISIGTTQAVRQISNQIALNDDVYSFCYQIEEDRYLIGLPSNNGGNVLEWLNEIFQASFEEVEQIITSSSFEKEEEIPIFLPFLNGERAPLWKSDATASFYGVSRITTRKAFILSVVLGMLFNIRYNVECLSKIEKVDTICVTGGVTHSAIMMQLLANVLGMEILVPKDDSVETLGSALLIDTETLVNLTCVGYQPEQGEKEKLEKLYQQFKNKITKYLCLH